MVNHEVADFFAYDYLTNVYIHKNLFGREVDSRPALIPDFRLGVVDALRFTLIEGRESRFEGKGATAGRIFRLYHEEETELVRLFVNRANKNVIKYTLEEFEARELVNNKSSEITTVVLTPIIRPSQLIKIEELDRRYYGSLPNRNMTALFRAARLTREQYLAHLAPQPWEVLVGSL